MNSAKKVILLLLIVQCCVFFAQSQYLFGQYHFDSWTTNNGLPQNGIRAITQTPDGYLWFTTFDGLVRFDGLRFTAFNKSNTKGIINNRFTSIYSDKDGTVYASTTEDGVLTVYRNGVFTSYTSEQVPGKLHSLHQTRRKRSFFTFRHRNRTLKREYFRCFQRPGRHDLAGDQQRIEPITQKCHYGLQHQRRFEIIRKFIRCTATPKQYLDRHGQRTKHLSERKI